MDLKEYILEQVSDRKLSPDIAKKILMGLKEEDTEPIAIIGMAGKFADSNNKDEFWNLLQERKNAIRTLPEKRIEDAKFLTENSCYAEFLMGIDLDKNENLSELLKKCGYLKEIDKFDHEFFGISANEAKYMDPYQRLFLEMAYHAAEDGGYSQNTLYGTRTGVFAGRDHTYVSLYQYCTKPDQMHMTGSWTGILSSRISYIFNLSGPSIVIDTACSSGLVAVHTACQSLLKGECDMAIAGGISLTLCEVDADKIGKKRNLKSALDMSMVEAYDSSVRTFDNDASGTVWGEGVGAILLKPLSKAIKDGDMIHAVIKGSAINNDGASSGITAPSAEAQTDVMLKAWENARINPETISYIEAHGTGTKIGDPIEIKGITNAFKRYTDKKQFCGIGTVKTNIGHLVGASGMASLFKVVMAMEKKCIPASINFNMPNQFIDFINSPLYISDSSRKWIKQEHPLRAGINSFGFSGTNCHVVIEEAGVEENNKKEIVCSDCVLTLSAKSLVSMKEMIRLYGIHLDHVDDSMIERICYTSNIGRGHYDYRAAVIGNTIAELKEGLLALGNLEQNSSKKGSYYSRFKVIENQRPVTESFQIKEAEQKSLTEQAAKLMSCYTAQGMSDREVINQICERYVHGAEVNWLDLYYDRKMKKVSLPLYPFVPKRIWAPLKEIAGHTEREKYKHPLFECLLSASVNENVFLSEFTVDKYWILNEHSVAGSFIVPGTAFIEMAREAGKSVFGDNNITFENILFYQPLVVDRNSKIYVQTIISKKKDDSEFLIISSSTCDFSKMENVTKHAEGKIYLNIEESVQKNEWLQEKIMKWDVVEKQIGEKESNFILGERWNNIATEYQGEDELLVALKLKADYAEDLELYNLYPSLLDNAVNAAIQTIAKGFYLPFFYKKIQVFGKLPLEFYSHILIQDNTDQTVTLDVQLLDMQGRVLVSIVGYEIKKVTKINLGPKVTPEMMQLKWIKFPIKDTEYLDQETIIVCKSGDKFSTEVIEYLRSRNHQVIVVEKGRDYSHYTYDTYEISDELKDYISLFADLKGKNIDRIIHMFSMDAVYDADNLNTFEENQKKGIYSILNIIKAITEVRIKTKISINVITKNSCLISNVEKTIIPENTALHNLLRVIGNEYPKLVVKTADVDEDMSVDMLMKQLVSDSKYCNIAYRRNESYIQSIRKISTVTSQSEIQIKDGATYLITGGSGGLGLKVAEHIADAHKVNFVLIGKTKLGETEQWNRLVEESDNLKIVRLVTSIKELEKKKCQVLYKCVDVADYEQVGKMVGDVHEKFGKISGVIHAAGIPGDGFLLNKEIAEFKKVVSPKIYGTWNIDHATRKEPLDFFMMFSSIETILASPGQADYVTANSYMNAYASYRNKYASNTIAVSWAAWKEVGMARDMDAINNGAESVFYSLTTENALAALDEILDAKYENVICADLKYNRNTEILDSLNFELDDSILSLFSEKQSEQTKAKVHGKAVHVIGQTTTNTALARIQSVLAEVWGNVLGLDAIDIYESFYSMGGDSIMAIQLFKAIDLEYPGIIDISDIFTYPSIAQLSGYVMSESNLEEAVAETKIDSEQSEKEAEDVDLLKLLDQVESGEISVDSGFDMLDKG